MAKAELKTKQTEASVEEFLAALTDEDQRADAFHLLALFKRVTGDEPKMWGPAIIGFGHRVLKYDSGRELDWMVTGFSPRKGTLSLYSLIGTASAEALLVNLGKYKAGKGCLYIKKFSDIDQTVLEQLIKEAVHNPGC